VEELDCHRPRDPASYAGGGTRSRHGRKRVRWESGGREAAVLLEEREGEESEEKNYTLVFIFGAIYQYLYFLCPSQMVFKNPLLMFFLSNENQNSLLQIQGKQGLLTNKRKQS